MSGAPRDGGASQNPAATGGSTAEGSTASGGAAEASAESEARVALSLSANKGGGGGADAKELLATLDAALAVASGRRLREEVLAAKQQIASAHGASGS